MSWQCFVHLHTSTLLLLTDRKIVKRRVRTSVSSSLRQTTTVSNFTVTAFDEFPEWMNVSNIYIVCLVWWHRGGSLGAASAWRRHKTRETFLRNIHTRKRTDVRAVARYGLLTARCRCASMRLEYLHENLYSSARSARAEGSWRPGVVICTGASRYVSKNYITRVNNHDKQRDSGEIFRKKKLRVSI